MQLKHGRFFYTGAYQYEKPKHGHRIDIYERVNSNSNQLLLFNIYISKHVQQFSYFKVNYLLNKLVLIM